jgi:hypothetical protein
MFRFTLLATAVALCLEGSASAEGNTQASAIKVLQFDAIIELDAPILKSHVVLFARYWVASSFYRIAILWAEPHAVNLNFPMYPVTMAVDSNEREFSVTNQVQGRLGGVFDKPVGERLIFRHRLNSYPAGEMRFTETEALASRIYRDDVEMLAPWLGDGVHTVNLDSRAGKGEVRRDIAALNLRVSHDRVDAVDIVDANGLLVKRIAYEYAQEQGRDILCRQETLLPERPLLLGYGERGVRIRVNDTERTFKELYGLDHEGGRKCRVEYEPIEAGDTTLSLPVHIAVQRADNGLTLRTARMSGFVLLKQSPEEVQCVAKQVGPFSREELRVRALFAKHWNRDPNAAISEDAAVLRHLQEHFETHPPDETLGEKVRRVNMLMQLAWLQHDRLADYFREYLSLLSTNGLDQAALIGGLNTIDTAIRRRDFPKAAELFREWACYGLNQVPVETVLAFAQAQIGKGHPWTIARLLEEGAKSGGAWADRQFDAQAIRCIALHKLVEMMSDPAKSRTQTAGAEAAWASAALGPNDIYALAGGEFATAQRLFEEVAKPNSGQRSLKAMLDRIERDMEKEENSRSPDMVVP